MLSVEVLTALPAKDVVEDCVAVYAAAFGEPPYDERVDAVEAFRRRVSDYATLPGFRLVVARRDGRVVGVIVAKHAIPGQRWREHIATVLGPAGTARWLGDAALEIVHVGVHPDARRHGVARAMMAAVEDDDAVRTSLLMAWASVDTAQRLYLSLGYRLLADDVHFGDSPQLWLMGHLLR